MKKIKAIIILLSTICLSTYLSAQMDDLGRISILAYQPESEGIPEEARSYLESKMQDVITLSGFACNELSQRFIITSKIRVVERDITPTNPVRISQKLELSFIIGDVVENKVYASTTINASGIGVTETKSLIQAFQRIKADNPNIQKMVQNAKEGIIAYYTDNCQFILTKAENMAHQQKYDEAICNLLAVPNVCSECYMLCQEKASVIYDDKINHEGMQLLQEAKAAWNVHKNYDDAEIALSIIAKINVQAACIDEANEFIKEINIKLRQIEASIQAQRKVEWDFKMQKYQDDLADRRTKMENSHQETMKFMDVLNVFAGKPRLVPFISHKRSIF